MDINIKRTEGQTDRLKKKERKDGRTDRGRKERNNNIFVEFYDS